MACIQRNEATNDPKFIIWIGLLLFLTNCHVSWYTKGIADKEKINSLDTVELSGLKNTPNLCLVSNMRFLPPIDSTQMISFDPYEINSRNPNYKIQNPTYTGLDPEFVLFLKERLKSRLKIQSKIQIFGIPNRYEQEKTFDLLKSPKSFNRYENLATLKQNQPVISDLLKSYADIVDSDTVLLYGSTDPFSHNIPNCNSYLYLSKYRSKQDTYNSLLFLLSFGFIPEFQYQDHYYDIILRSREEDRIRTKTFVFGYRRGLSWIFLPTLGMFNSVSSFDKDYQFSEESEEMLLDSISEVLERSL